ncbi:MAG: hypothetical protein ABFR97_04660 [Thermodesulfobacteriota bacterium]
MYDDDLKYCPQCHDEYRAEIESCAACGLLLLPGAEMAALGRQEQAQVQARKGELRDDDEIITIHKGGLAELRHLEKVFKAENIGVIIMGDQPAGCQQGCCPTDYYLQVRKEDGMAAVALIRAEFHKATALDSHDLDHVDQVFNSDASHATCPACGFEFETSTTICPDCGLCFG